MKNYFLKFLIFSKLFISKIKQIFGPKMKLRGKGYSFKLNSKKFINFYDLKCNLAELVTEGDFEARSDIEPKEIYPFCVFNNNTLYLSFFCTYENIVMHAEGKINIISGDITVEYEQFFDVESDKTKAIKDRKLLKLLKASKNKVNTRWEKDYVEYNDHKLNKYIIRGLKPLIEKYLTELSKIPNKNICLTKCPYRYNYEILGECDKLFCKGGLYIYKYVPSYNSSMYIRIM
jgi:hypothetical protein